MALLPSNFYTDFSFENFLLIEKIKKTLYKLKILLPLFEAEKHFFRQLKGFLMNTKNKFIRIAFASMLLGLTSSALFADENTSQPMMKQPSADNSRQQTMAPALGDKIPPYNNPDRFVLQGSFIYWQADMDGLDYSLQQKATVTTPPLGTSRGTVASSNPPSSYTDTLKQKDLDFKWEPGFKLGVGIIFGERDQWDILLNWTWIRPKAHRSLNSGPTPDISSLSNTSLGTSPIGLAPVSTTTTISNLAYQIPGFSPLLLQSPATYSKTKWTLLYNTVDLELGRNFFLAKNLTLRPHMGLRGAFLHHTTETEYNISSTSNVLNQVTDTLILGSASGTSRFKGKNEYDAVGLRGGLDIRWNFTNHFCVYGSVSGAILYGIFSIEEDFNANYTVVQTTASQSIGGETTTTTTPTSTDADFKTNLHRTRSTLQAALGLMWHTGFNNDKYHASIGASYEVNQWFQQNELRDIQNNLVDLKAQRTPGDLGLHGFTLDVKFDF